MRARLDVTDQVLDGDRPQPQPAGLRLHPENQRVAVQALRERVPGDVRVLGRSRVQVNVATPRLVLDESGLQCGAFYAADNIYKAEPAIRSVVLTILKDGKVKEKIVSLGWASRDDYKSIIALLTERFQREVPK